MVNSGSSVEADNANGLLWATQSDFNYFHEFGAGSDNIEGFDISYNWVASHGRFMDVAWVRDDTAKTIELFINGVSRGTQPYTNSATGATTTPYVVGGDNSGGSRAQDLLIGNIAHVGGAKWTAAQLKTRYERLLGQVP